MLFVQVVSALLGVTSVAGTEVAVPERYLRPRHFNHHPLQTLLGVGPLSLPHLLTQHPYQYFPRARGRQEDSSPVQFPAIPEAVKPTKSNTPGYISVPKNYAFAYAVKDRQSGDDFSHKQAHNGQSTKGEYRVKLPDGRTQIVSYTADHTGYKADVRYDEAKEPEPSVYYSQGYSSLSNSILQEQDYPEEPEIVYKQPVQILHKQNRVAQQYTPKVQPTARPLEVLFSPSPRPYKIIAQLRTLPQTAEEYTSSDTPNYYPSHAPSAGYYAPPVSSTTATPIMEDQDDVPAPPKPNAGSSYTLMPPGVRYVLVPHPTQYVYTDS